jgi:hypothetical protein
MRDARTRPKKRAFIGWMATWHARIEGLRVICGLGFIFSEFPFFSLYFPAVTPGKQKRKVKYLAHYLPPLHNLTAANSMQNAIDQKQRRESGPRRAELQSPECMRDRFAGGRRPCVTPSAIKKQGTYLGVDRDWRD